ncbi:MAG TPA: hypothetical protein VHZ81_05900 [Galbitalea sp.]|nr:hypothetical protein [Galbitalea sp.]
MTVAWILRGITAAIFLVMGINHFRPRVARGMAAMIPPTIRRDGILKPLNLVYFTGVCELLGAVGILLPWTRLAAGIALAVFLVAVFPANAYAAGKREKFGRFSTAFWPRLVLQLVLIALVLVAALLG